MEGKVYPSAGLNGQGGTRRIQEPATPPGSLTGSQGPKHLSCGLLLLQAREEEAGAEQLPLEAGLLADASGNGVSERSAHRVKIMSFSFS